MQSGDSLTEVSVTSTERELSISCDVKLTHRVMIEKQRMVLMQP